MEQWCLPPLMCTSDHHYCLEVIIMKGKSKEIQEMADKMLATRGVELGKLVLTNSGAALKQAK